MTVLIVGYTEKKTSGVKTHIDSLLVGLKKSGVSVEILDTRIKGLARLGLSVILRFSSLFSKSTSQRLKITLLKIAFQNELIKFKTDDLVVNFQSVVWYAVFREQVEKANIPFVVTVHGPYSEELKSKGYPTYFINEALSIEKAAYNSASKIVAVSETMKQYLVNLSNRSDVEVIFNGVVVVPEELIVFKRESSQIKCVYLGRLEKSKGVHVAIEVISILISKGIDVKLDIIGDGTERRNLVKLVEMLKLGNHVKFLGVIPNHIVRKKLQTYDISLIPSLPFGDQGEEPFNYVCIESMSAGLITIASKIGGMKNTISDKIDGFLVTPNCVIEIVNIVEEYYKDQTKFVSIKKNAIEKIQNKYSCEIMANKYAIVYNQVLDKKV